MKKRVVTSLLALATVAMLASCGNTSSVVASSEAASEQKSESSQTVEGIRDGIRASYIMDGQNVVRVEVAVKDSKITSAQINEAMYFADDLGLIKDADAQKADTTDTFTISVSDWSGNVSEETHAKHIYVGGKVFEGKAREAANDAGANTIYSADGIDDLFTYVTSSQENLAWYYNAMESKDVALANASGEKIAGSVTGTVQSRGGLLKNDVNNLTYWPDSYTAATANKWLLNADKIEQDLVGKNLDTDTLTLKGSAAGATIESYNYYITAAKAAFDGNEGEYFGVSYVMDGQNVVRTEVLKKEGKVVVANINEAMYFADNLGLIKDADAQKADSTDTFTISVSDWSGNVSEETHAKHIYVGGKVFSGSAREAANDGGENTIYTADGIDDLYTYVTSSEANLEWYYNAMMSKDVALANASGEKIAGSVTGTEQGRGGLYKNDVTNLTYWPDSYTVATANKWLINIDKIEAALVGKNLDSATPSKSDSGATIESFDSYIQGAKAAFDR